MPKFKITIEAGWTRDKYEDEVYLPSKEDAEFYAKELSTSEVGYYVREIDDDDEEDTEVYE